MPVFYRQKQIGTHRVDFLVKNVVSVELKAITKLEDVLWHKLSIILKHTIWKSVY
jgi:hypothetical protein